MKKRQIGCGDFCRRNCGKRMVRDEAVCPFCHIPYDRLLGPENSLFFVPGPRHVSFPPIRPEVQWGPVSHGWQAFLFSCR